MLVPVSVLKANLSNILARAQSGEIIEVTSDGKPIARIIGIPAASSQPLGALAGNDAVTWNGKKPSFHLLQSICPNFRRVGDRSAK